MATKKKAEFLKRYGRAGAAEGWHFLTGPQESIDALTKAAGFQYQYDPKTGQFAHATAIMILTPEGKIAQYYYGVDYAPKDLRLGLIQASREQDRHAGRPGIAVLLSLRSHDRQVRSNYFAGAEAGGACHSAGAGNFDDCADPFGIGTQGACGKMMCLRERQSQRRRTRASDPHTDRADDRGLKTDD